MAYYQKLRSPHFGGTSADYEVKSSESIFYGEGLRRGIRKRHHSFSKEIFTLWSIPGLFVARLVAYFLGKQGSSNATLLPETFYSTIFGKDVYYTANQQTKKWLKET